MIVRVIDVSAMIQQKCLINQPAWLTIRQWLIVTLIIHSSSQSSSINQLAWLIIRVIDYSTMIRQWLFNQPARVIDYSTRLKSHWLFASSRDWWFDNDWGTLIIRQLAWLIIRQWLSHIDYSWLINQLIKLIIHSSSQLSSINQLAWLIIRS